MSATAVSPPVAPVHAARVYGRVELVLEIRTQLEEETSAVVFVTEDFHQKGSGKISILSLL